MPVTDLREALLHRDQREVARFGLIHLVPVERRRNAGVRGRPHGIGAGDGAVLGVLVVVDEDAMSLFFPPLAGRQRRHASFDVTRQRQCGAADIVVGPLWLDAHAHVHAALA